MKLNELYSKEFSQKKTFEVLRSDGTPSGGHITLKSPDDDAAALAFMRFNRLLGKYAKYFESKHELLQKECEEAGDFREYNYMFNAGLIELNNALAIDIVEGWDFDDVFSVQALENILKEFNGLGEQVVTEFINSINEQQKK